MLAVSTAHGCCLMWSCNKWIGTAGRPYKEYRDLLLDFMKRHSKSHTFQATIRNLFLRFRWFLNATIVPNCAQFERTFQNSGTRTNVELGARASDTLICYFVTWFGGRPFRKPLDSLDSLQEKGTNSLFHSVWFSLDMIERHVTFHGARSAHAPHGRLPWGLFLSVPGLGFTPQTMPPMPGWQHRSGWCINGWRIYLWMDNWNPHFRKPTIHDWSYLVICPHLVMFTSAQRALVDVLGLTLW